MFAQAAQQPAFITETNTTEFNQGTLSLQSFAHLIRRTSIISSSDPYKLTVQGEREAAPGSVHHVQAICWALSLVPPSPGLRPHKGDCALIPVHLAYSPSAPRSPRRQGAPQDALHWQHPGGSHGKCPDLPSGHTDAALLSLTRLLAHTEVAPPPEGAKLQVLGRHSTQTTPTPAGVLPR